MLKPSRQPGFSLMEILISLTMTSVLAAMLLPMLANNVNGNKMLGTVKDAVAQLGRAYSVYLEDNVAQDATTAQNIIDNLNYVRQIAPAENISIQVDGATNLCDAAEPCVLLHTGAILQYEADAQFQDAAAPETAELNRDALRFIIDPDGAGVQPSVSFVMFINGRISTRRYAPFATFYTTGGPENLPDDTTEPIYIWPWTSG